MRSEMSILGRILRTIRYDFYFCGFFFLKVGGIYEYDEIALLYYVVLYGRGKII